MTAGFGSGLCLLMIDLRQKHYRQIWKLVRAAQLLLETRGVTGESKINKKSHVDLIKKTSISERMQTLFSRETKENLLENDLHKKNRNLADLCLSVCLSVSV